MKSGVFIDIGAHDGSSLSNTWFFEKKLGWKGICFEPSPLIFKKLAENRSCICLNEAVSDKQGTVIFREIQGYCQMLSGIENNYDPQHLQRIENELGMFGGSYRLIEVPCCLFNQILEKNSLFFIDFLSVDTEGGELKILKSIDFDKFYIFCICVENNYQYSDLRTFLESKGFKYIATLGDEIYINQN